MKIAVAGYICLDMTPTFPDTGQHHTVSEILTPGKLIQVGRPEVAVGGCVSNTGLALNYFGAETTLIAKLGKDSFGHLILEQFKDHSADTSGFIISEGYTTSYTFALAIPGNDRIFLADPGANDGFSTDDIDFECLRSSELFHFGYPTLMRRFYENKGSECVSLFKKVKSMGLITSMDIAMTDPDSRSGMTNWTDIFKKVLPYVDIFTPSFEELCFLIDRPKYERIKKRSKHDDMCMHLSLDKDIIPLAEKVLAMGCRAVLLKCGAPGMFLATSTAGKMKKISPLFSDEWGDLSIFEESYIPDRICSGTGAGDTSIAAFLYSLLSGRSPQQCLHNAAGTGAMNLTAYDSLSGILPIEKLEEKIAAGWKKQHLLKIL